MWLLDTTTLDLVDRVDPDKHYAILSHVWEVEEVSFAELQENRQRAERKKGFAKIWNCCQIARKRFGLSYAWIDTCCIDKRSSAELSEAINSMYKWYKNAYVCLVYLHDVRPRSDDGEAHGHQLKEVKSSVWFTRGWTLQELLAPDVNVYLAADWSEIERTGRYSQDPDHNAHKLFTASIADAAHIPENVVSGTSARQYCIAQRLSWASRRRTTRPEDIAYSLMGLFDVNMPIIYGEGGKKALQRLQHEVPATTRDRSIFAWCMPRGIIGYEATLLASEVGYFAQIPTDFSHGSKEGIPWEDGLRFLQHSITNIGIMIMMQVIEVKEPTVHLQPADPIANHFVLGLIHEYSSGAIGTHKDIAVGIYLRRLGKAITSTGECESYARCRCEELAKVPSELFAGSPHQYIVIVDHYHGMKQMDLKLPPMRWTTPIESTLQNTSGPNLLWKKF